MDVIVTLEDKQDNYKEEFIIKNILDKKHFSYKDNSGIYNDIHTFNDGISIYRKAQDHQTYVILRNKSYIKIRSSEGTLKFYVKALALCINNDIISIGYYINDSFKQIKIEYIGE